MSPTPPTQSHTHTHFDARSILCTIEREERALWVWLEEWTDKQEAGRRLADGWGLTSKHDEDLVNAPACLVVRGGRRAPPRARRLARERLPLRVPAPKRVPRGGDGDRPGLGPACTLISLAHGFVPSARIIRVVCVPCGAGRGRQSGWARASLSGSFTVDGPTRSVKAQQPSTYWAVLINFSVSRSLCGRRHRRGSRSSTETERHGGLVS